MTLFLIVLVQRASLKLLYDIAIIIILADSLLLAWYLLRGLLSFVLRLLPLFSRYSQFHFPLRGQHRRYLPSSTSPLDAPVYEAMRIVAAVSNVICRR